MRRPLHDRSDAVAMDTLDLVTVQLYPSAKFADAGKFLVSAAVVFLLCSRMVLLACDMTGKAASHGARIPTHRHEGVIRATLPADIAERVRKNQTVRTGCNYSFQTSPKTWTLSSVIRLKSVEPVSRSLSTQF